jgi:ABC-type multidrug transport system ATPase subunit
MIDDTDAILRVDGLRVAYPGQAPLFEALSFTLPPGLTRLDAETGKTTLLRVLAGRMPATGRFTLDGADWTPGEGPGTVAALDPRDAAWDALTPDGLADRLRVQYPAWSEAAWETGLERFGLGEHRHKTLHMLSSGSRRKVSLAATLASDARLNLLDEAVAGLDRPSIGALAEALDEEAERGERAWLIAAAWGLEDRLRWAQVLAL